MKPLAFSDGELESNPSESRNDLADQKYTSNNEQSYNQELDSEVSFYDSSPEIVRKGILELYLNVKIRSADEVSFKLFLLFV